MFRSSSGARLHAGPYWLVPKCPRTGRSPPLLPVVALVVANEATPDASSPYNHIRGGSETGRSKQVLQ
jgi:hypothetical protein